MEGNKRSPTWFAEELRVFGFEDIGNAIEKGQGYVIITLDPDGLVFTPVNAPKVEQTLVMRSRLRKMRHYLTAGPSAPGAVAVPADNDEEPPSSDDRSGTDQPQMKLQFG